MRTRLLLILIAVSWVADAQTSGLELPVRLSYLGGLIVAVTLGFSSGFRRSSLYALGMFFVANSVWLFAGARNGAAVSTAAIDFVVVLSFGAAVLSSNRLRGALADLDRRWLVVPVAGLVGAVLVGVLASSGGRGELPPTALLAVSFALVAHKRYVWGASGVAAYLLLTFESGFRSSALLVLIAGLLVAARLFVDSKLWVKSLVVIAAVPLVLTGFGIVQEALDSELAADTRALQFSTSGTNASASDAARAAEIRSSFGLVQDSGPIDYVLGLGHGSKVLDAEFDRRTAHNVWLTFSVRYGILGFLGVVWAHYRVAQRCRRFIKADATFLDALFAIGGLLVLVNGYLRFSIAELSEFLLLAVAIGGSSRDG